jgi:hypothetical protein
MRYLTVLTLTVLVFGPDNATLGQPKDQSKLAEIVKIEFPKDGYTFTLDEAAKGVKVTYKIIVEKDVEGVIALQYGPSFREPAGPSELHPRERIWGDDQLYCLMDFGLAPPRREQDEKAKTIKKGVFAHSFEWDGRNWTGPSDFGNKKGKAFPTGTYNVTVSFHGKLVTEKGKTPYEVTGKTKLVLK